MTEIDDSIRVGVLGALVRGMTISYAARADGITLGEAEAIAEAAGWPDPEAAREALLDLQRTVQHPHLPAGAVPLERVPEPQPVVPARSAVREFQSTDEQGAAMFGRTTRTIPARGAQVIEPGRFPDGFVAPSALPVPTAPRPAETTTADLIAAAEDAYDELAEARTRGDFDLVADIDRALGSLQEEIEQSAMEELRSGPGGAGLLPGGTDNQSGPRPCVVCGAPVRADYIALTGRARHGWHPEVSPDAGT